MANSKLYVHYDGDKGPSMTHVFKNAKGENSIGAIIEEFMVVYNKRNDNSASTRRMDDVILRDASGAIVSTKQSVADFLETGECDLMLTDARPNTDSLISPELKEAMQYYSRGQYRSVKKALEAAEFSSSEAPYVKCILGDILRQNKRHTEALDMYAQVLEMNNPSVETECHALIGLSAVLKETAQFEAAVAKYRKALAMMGSGSRSIPYRLFTKPDVARIKASLASCLYSIGTTNEQNQAVTLLNSLIKADTVDSSAHLLYARVLHDRGAVAQAIQVVLNVLVEDPKNKFAQRRFVGMITTQQGFLALQADVLPSNASPAYALLAMFAKDHGAIEESIAMLQIAVKHSPESASYALNLTHMFEITVQPPEALKCLRQYLTRNPTRQVLGVSCDQVSQALDGLPVSPVVDSEQPTTLEPDDLDVLALWFTLVKVLFSLGKVNPILAIAELIEPGIMRQQNPRLHLTSIRNENAYYRCIVQLLSVPGILGQPSEEQRQAIYVVGDSHVLPMAWRSVSLKSGDESSLVLHPRLVTGLKHWHLRKDTEFYPKKNFYNTIKAIPQGSSVIFVLGEIDCREGILHAVERCRYNTLDEGIAYTIGVFMQALEAVILERNLIAYIHPIPPVLDETRSIVNRYNECYRKAVETSHLPVKWLDFVDSLLDQNEQLRYEYKLDGTHLHPSYLTHLSRALDDVGV